MSAFVGNVFFALVNLLAIVHFLNGVPFDGSGAAQDCATVRQTFQSKNISRPPDKPINGDKLAICRSDKSCCTLEMETQLKTLVKKDYQTMLQNHVQSVQGIIVLTAIHFKDYIHEMMLKAEGKTLKIFEDWFVNTTISANASVRSFYRQLDEYLSSKTELDTIGSWRTSVTDQQQPIATGGADDAASSSLYETSKLTEITSRFFVELFPLVYRLSLNSSAANTQQFHPEFTSCLQSRLDDVKPFGELAKTLEKDIVKTLESTKVLIAALNFGVDILNESNQLIAADDKNDQCYQALLKMSYCPLCNAYTASVKPCPNYCLNVIQGCLVRYSADLDAPWSGYYKAVDKLISVINGSQLVICLEDLLKDFHLRIKETLTPSQDQVIHNKVKHLCGNVRWINGTESNDSSKQSASQIIVNAESTVTNSKVTVNQLDGNAEEKDLSFRSSLLSNKVKRFKDSVPKSIGLYGNLANVLCSDESFVEKSNLNKCWNGQTIGQYSKAVLSNAVSSQMYNPEIPWSAMNSTDPNLTQLVEKLRRVRQIVSNLQRQLSLNSELNSFNQMGSEEGSGMGSAAAGSDTYGDDEDSNTEFPDQGSGSGETPMLGSNAPVPDNRDVVNRNLPEPPPSDNDDTEIKNPTDPNDKKVVTQNPSSTAGLSADLPFITTLILCTLMTLCYRACFLQ